MQRTTSVSTTRQTAPTSSSAGRRAYNRAPNNSFKFHNFVFNQDNHNFCLEEQHGNKKITVLHWKKCDGATLLPSETSETSETSQVSRTSSSSLLSSECDNSARGNAPSLSSACLAHSLSSGVFVSPSSHSCVIHPADLISNLDHPGSSKSTLPSNSSAYGTNFSSFASNYSSLTSDLAGCSFRRPRTPSPPFSKRISNHRDVDKDDAFDDDDEMDSDEDDDDDDDFKDYLSYRDQFKLHSQFMQQQPLDLSLKSKGNIDHNNNHGGLVAQDSKDDDETLSICEEENLYSSKYANTLLSSECFRFAPNISVSSSEMDLVRPKPRPLPLVRDESISPSLFISSVKCCSPAPPSSSSSKLPTDRMLNPFLYPITSHRLPCPPSLHTLPECPPPAPPPTHSAPSSSLYSHAQRHSTPPPPLPPRPFKLDTFIEEEIYKILQSSSSSSSSSPPSSLLSNSMSAFSPPPPPLRVAATTPLPGDVQPMSLLQSHARKVGGKQSREEESIEEKLKRLQREIQHKVKQDDELDDLKAITQAGASSSQDHLRLHFKLDANKRLEPYRGVEANKPGPARVGGGGGIGNPMQLASSPMNQLSKARGVMNHRNQMKRQLEESFKQNGFLVKTKQVSDANNSAMFCKFRQLRKYTRYYLKSWQSHLPDEVGKLLKGFLPPKTEQSMFPLPVGIEGDDDDDGDDDDEDRSNQIETKQEEQDEDFSMSWRAHSPH